MHNTSFCHGHWCNMKPRPCITLRTKLFNRLYFECNNFIVFLSFKSWHFDMLSDVGLKSIPRDYNYKLNGISHFSMIRNHNLSNYLVSLIANSCTECHCFSSPWSIFNPELLWHPCRMQLKIGLHPCILLAFESKTRQKD